jgi:hypothetical protein
MHNISNALHLLREPAVAESDGLSRDEALRSRP